MQLWPRCRPWLLSFSQATRSHHTNEATSGFGTSRHLADVGFEATAAVHASTLNVGGRLRAALASLPACAAAGLAAAFGGGADVGGDVGVGGL